MQIVLISIAFIAAFGVAYYSVYVNEKFNTLFFLIYKSKPVILYSVCYGLIGALIFLILKEDVLKITDDTTTISVSFLKAFSTGISTKAIADINFFNIKGGNTQTPIGIKTFTKPLDKFFERQFNDIGYIRSSEFLKPFYDKFKTVKDITIFKDEVTNSLKFYPDQDFVAGFVTGDGFVKAQKPDEVLALVLSEFGETVFKKIFDLSKKP